MLQDGAELLVSAFRDPDFGVMLSAGADGPLTELLDDVVWLPSSGPPQQMHFAESA